MWNRKQLKGNAKNVLRTTFLVALGVSVIYCLFLSLTRGQIQSKLSGLSFFQERIAYTIRTTDAYGMMDVEELFYTIGNHFVGLASSPKFRLVTTLGILGSFFFLNVLLVGVYKYFSKTAGGQEAGVGEVSFGFKEGRFGKIFGAMFLRDLYTTLWSFLFFIPGIIKTYAYRMVPFILADNPDIGANRAIQLSQEMMRGHKGEVFILDISFFGWALLASFLPLGLGSVLLFPYTMATDAQLYQVLRYDSIHRGITSPDELQVYYTEEVAAPAAPQEPQGPHDYF